LRSVLPKPRRNPADGDHHQHRGYGAVERLAPEFKKATGIDLRWTATGTGKALKLGEDCNVDVLMVHAPGAEKKFVDAGFGLNRREIMTNDFIIVGPAADPAGIKGTERQGRPAGHPGQEGGLRQPRGQVRHPHDGA
jgi:hypothetical protein